MTEFEEKVIKQNDHIIALLEAIQHVHNPTPGFGLLINNMIRTTGSYQAKGKKSKEKEIVSDEDRAMVANLKRRKDSGEDVEKIAKDLGFYKAVYD